ncbi:unnamed protein product [Trifolium pratense]|uniref:Uncharacterized protein n=1 Tax=Trifolium pratense TaxID=57577 RepID=A0ACB0ITV8_TRIPR|nr:unnamed protein product [Trifolium pratense]
MYVRVLDYLLLIFNKIVYNSSYDRDCATYYVIQTSFVEIQTSDSSLFFVRSIVFTPSFRFKPQIRSFNFDSELFNPSFISRKASNVQLQLRIVQSQFTSTLIQNHSTSIHFLCKASFQNLSSLNSVLSIIQFSFENRTVANGVDKKVTVLSKLGSSSITKLHHKVGSQGASKPTNMPPTLVMTRLILIMV